MRRAIVIAAVIGLVGGLTGAWVFGQLSGNAGAAPQAQQVREQNLDGSGFIRVHEQGTANVNVTGGSVSVSNLPSGPKFFVLATSQTVDPGQVFTTPFVDTGGCQKFTLVLRFSAGLNPDAVFKVLLSADGTRADANLSLASFKQQASFALEDRSIGSSYVQAGILWPPRVAIAFDYSDGGSASFTFSAFLYCLS